MKLTVVDKSEIQFFKKTKLQELLDEFVKMDVPVVRVDAHDYKSANSCACALSAAAKRFRKGIKVIQRGENVYLARDMEE